MECTMARRPQANSLTPKVMVESAARRLSPAREHSRHSLSRPKDNNGRARKSTGNLNLDFSCREALKASGFQSNTSEKRKFRSSFGEAIENNLFCPPAG